jgi:hypothetical protein
VHDEGMEPREWLLVIGIALFLMGTFYSSWGRERDEQDRHEKWWNDRDPRFR